MARNENSWADGTFLGVPYDRPTTIPLTVSGGDHPWAIKIAGYAPRALAAAQNLDKLGELDKSTLYYLLNDVNKIAESLDGVRDELILAHHAAGGSWGELGAALDRDRQSAKERYLRLVAARARGAEPADSAGPAVTVVAGRAVVGSVIGGQVRACLGCACSHAGGCLTCGCTCPPYCRPIPDTCACCGVNDENAMTPAPAVRLAPGTRVHHPRWGADGTVVRVLTNPASYGVRFDGTAATESQCLAGDLSPIPDTAAPAALVEGDRVRHIARGTTGTVVQVLPDTGDGQGRSYGIQFDGTDWSEGFHETELAQIPGKVRGRGRGRGPKPTGDRFRATLACGHVIDVDTDLPWEFPCPTCGTVQKIQTNRQV